MNGGGTVTAEELARRFGLRTHCEHGSFLETHYPCEGAERPLSGSMYYYLAGGEYSLFHRLDCGEYWTFHAGSPLEIWMLSPDGALTVKTLGVGAEQSPAIYVPEGTLFGTRHRGSPEEGTFLSCITVPRFRYEGSELREDKDALLEKHPQLAPFFED